MPPRLKPTRLIMKVLSELAEPDLEKLGVAIGHRKKLLKAIPPWRGRRRHLAERQAARG